MNTCKNPDKIYIHEASALELAEPVLKEYHIEYIREDALLEWAKAEIELSKKVECVSEKSYEEGRQQVAQNLIDNLNSL